MLKLYLRIAVRNLWKNKIFSSINIMGLSLAIAAGVILMLTALRELSYDRFHDDLDRLYRVYRPDHRDGVRDYSSTMLVPLQPLLAEKVNALEYTTRLMGQGGDVIYNGEQYGTGVRYADPDFLKMFSFKMLQGDEDALAELNSVILAERTAQRIFGSENPLGKSIELAVGKDRKNLTVNGVIEDTPETSSIEYNVITRFENSPDYQDMRDNWDDYNHGVYVMVKEGMKKEDVEAQMKAEFAPVMRAASNDAIESGVYQEENENLYLQAFADLHFDRTVDRGGMNKAIPIGLLIIAFFILGIACINFVNLTLGSALSRSKEVGVRKVLGASKRQIIFQFWGEAFLLTIVALFAGLAIAKLGLPEYNSMLGITIKLAHPNLFLTLILVLLVVGIVGGGYPALVLSRFQPVSVLKGDAAFQKPGRVRRGLLLIQFSISIMLISCTIVVAQQLNYLRHKPLGFSKEEVISIPLGATMDDTETLRLMKQELSPYPAILSLAGGYDNLGMGRDGSAHTSILTFMHEEKEVYTHYATASHDYFETLGIEFVEGRSFSEQFRTDSISSVIINEKMADQLGGIRVGEIMDFEPKVEVIGILKNYHFKSLDEPIEPLTFILPNQDFPMGYLFARVRTENLATSMALIEKHWKILFPNEPFLASYLDENIDRQYKGEQVMSKIFISAALLAIGLSCMGLFGIAILVIARRTKEIGVRKVLGASISQIVGLISKDFLMIIAISILIAAPIVWWAMDSWLSNYAYRVSVQWAGVFFLAGFLAIGIAFLTISIQTIRAARANPIQALKTE